MAAPFTNGNFESPAAGIQIYAPGTGPSPWIFGTDGAAPNGGVHWGNTLNPTGGSAFQLVSLNDPTGSGLGSISQTFDVAPLTAYSVTFDLSAIADGGSDLYGLTVGATGNLPSNYAYTTGAAGNLEVPAPLLSVYAFTTGALQSSTTLTFSSTNFYHDYYGPTLDNVVVTAVPEPASCVLIGLATIGLVVAARRRQA